MRILIRADGDQHIGTGHVMRMLALAQQALLESPGDNDVVLASVRLDAGLAARAREMGVAVTLNDVEPGSPDDNRWLIEQAAALNADWAIVDGYSFDANYQDALRSGRLQVLFVDDLGLCSHYSAQLVLNQNAFATSALYAKRHSETRLLLGPAYVLLRREFVIRATPVATIAERADKILVTLGGADPQNATERLVRALERLTGGELRVKVVAGQSNSRGTSLAARNADPRIEVLTEVGEGGMAPLMAWADLAITSAGTTVYELCFMGVPTLVVAIAPYQRDVARALGPLVIDLGWHEDPNVDALAATIEPLRADRERRRMMSRRGHELVDGLGAKRVLDAMMAEGSRQA